MRNYPYSNSPAAELSVHKSSPKILGIAASSSLSPSPTVKNPSLPSGVPIKKPASSPTPKPQTLTFGVAVDDYANANGTITSIEQALSHPVAILSLYKQFGLADNKNLDPSTLSFAKSNKKKLLIAWEPWNPEEGTNQSTDYLKSIISGNQDDYINSFAGQIKNFGNPVELRFGHEMNGDWYPWGNRAKDYIAAYRHIVTLFRQDQVSNVTWMWCFNADNVPYTPMANVSQFYPGNDVVDVIGIDGFNFGSPGQWRSFIQIFDPAYTFALSTYHKKITIAETASSEQGGDKAAWIKTMFTTLSQNYPQITELIWFNILKERDWRINSTNSSSQAFKTNLNL